MATEIELKLSLSATDARTISHHPLLAEVPPRSQRLVNTYYDTPGDELAAAGLAVRLRSKGRDWLCTIKAADPTGSGLTQRSEWEAPARPGVIDVRHVDDPDLRARLEAALPTLEPRFTTTFRRVTWQVIAGRSRVEVALDRGQILAGARRAPIREVELELLSGEVSDLFDLALALQDRHALRPAVQTKAERGHALARGLTPSPYKARPIGLDDAWSPVEAFRAVAGACLDQYQRNAPGLGGADVEFVHQARVALRRLRTALKLFAPALPAAWVAQASSDWRDLAGALGEARDWDVFLSQTLPDLAFRFPDDPGLRRLDREGRRRARRARRAIAATLANPATDRLLLGFTAAVHGLPDHGDTSLREFARDALQVRARRARKLAVRHETLSPEERHKLRIRFKDLRYALEFFAPLLPKGRVKAYHRDLVRLTELLGRINDHLTTERLTEEVLVGGRPGPSHGWVAGRHELLLEELPAAIEGFLAAEAPWS